jgi:outer membrane immunogenic protein
VDEATYSASPSGFVGGVQIGYNWQFDQFVASVEVDFQGGRLKGGVSGGAAPYTFNAETKVDWFGTVRARIGYSPVERLMVYATGGLAYGHVKSYMSYAGYESSVSKTKTGYTVGGDAKYAFDSNLSMKTEYFY